jgi:hypothetical protein
MDNNENPGEWQGPARKQSAFSSNRRVVRLALSPQNIDLKRLSCGAYLCV